MRKPHLTSLGWPSNIPRSGEGKRGQAGHIGYLLRQANAAHRLRMERALADLQVTMPQFLVLTMIKAYSGISNADIARLSLLTPQTVCVIAANLERAALIDRRRDDFHGRIQHLEITSRGAKLLAQCRKRVQKIEQWLLKNLSAKEEQVIRRWLVAVTMRKSCSAALE